jgi:hypothetical protein
MTRDKREDWGFLDLGEQKIDFIKKELESYDKNWEIDKTRQTSYETHEHTHCISLKSLDYHYIIGSKAQCIESYRLESKDAQAELDKIINFLEIFSGGRAVRVEFINMKPNSRVRKHKDRSDLLYLSRRFHIPIKTNEKVLFFSENESRHLKLGRAYELNNIKYHSVVNSGEENRIHLIVDVLPNEYLEGVSFEHQQ